MIIKAVLEGKNTMVIQPTGSGKSLCFQLPGLITNKITIVLTPTISLMKDQCKKLDARGISATYLGSSQTDPHVMEKVMKGDFSIVYSTPEKFFECKRKFNDLSSLGRVGLIAVDEAHLAMSWKSFRYVS